MPVRLGRGAALAGLAAFVVGCALLPSEEPIGYVQPDGTLRVSSGEFADGTPWSVSARREGANLCTTIVIGDEPQGSGCTDVSNGSSGFGTSSGTDTPTTLEGVFQPPVVAVQIDASDGAHQIPLVPLDAFGLGGGAFGYVADESVRVTALSTLAADGSVIDRYPMEP